MASKERAGSFSSSSGDTATHEDDEKLNRIDHTEEGVESLKKPEELEIEEENGEDAGLLPGETKKAEPKSSFTSSLIWMVVNTLATIGIVCDHRTVLQVMTHGMITIANHDCPRRFSRTRPSSRIRP